MRTQVLLYYVTVSRVLPTSWCLMVMSRIFQLVETPTRGPIRISIGWIETSSGSCASSCFSIHGYFCKSFLFNSLTGLCTPAYSVRDAQPLPTAAEGKLYYNYRCDKSAGMNVYELGTSKVCLGLFEEMMNYTEADNTCRIKGTFLASVKTAAKMSLILSISKNNSLWLGSDNLGKNGTFVWREDEEQLSQQTIRDVFVQGDPNNFENNEQCISFENRFGKLIDFTCSALQYYVCEVGLP